MFLKFRIIGIQMPLDLLYVTPVEQPFSVRSTITSTIWGNLDVMSAWPPIPLQQSLSVTESISTTVSAASPSLSADFPKRRIDLKTHGVNTNSCKFINSDFVWLLRYITGIVLTIFLTFSGVI